MPSWIAEPTGPHGRRSCAATSAAAQPHRAGPPRGSVYLFGRCSRPPAAGRLDVLSSRLTGPGPAGPGRASFRVALSHRSRARGSAAGSLPAVASRPHPSRIAAAERRRGVAASRADSGPRVCVLGEGGGGMRVRGCLRASVRACVLECGRAGRAVGWG